MEYADGGDMSEAVDRHILKEVRAISLPHVSAMLQSDRPAACASSGTRVSAALQSCMAIGTLLGRQCHCDCAPRTWPGLGSDIADM